MISDTLSDAASEIRDYLREFPDIYGEPTVLPQIEAVLMSMDALRIRLDASIGARTCECADPLCCGGWGRSLPGRSPYGHLTRERCGRPAPNVLYRVDMDDPRTTSGMAFCNACANDAIHSGVFGLLKEALRDLEAEEEATLEELGDTVREIDDDEP